MRRCLVTGGAGFIGSHLTREALNRGYDVVVLDNLSSGRRENLTEVINHVELVEGDIRDRDLVGKLVRGTDLIFHEAALAEVPLCIENPVLSAQINDLGTLTVLEAAARAGVGRVVYASSSAVYGDSYPSPQHEGLPPVPDSPYAAHKLLGEHYGAIFGKLYGLEVASLRYFNVYGPRQDPASPYSGVISCFFQKIRQGLPPVIYGDGGQCRDFIFVRDVVEANFLAAQSPEAPGNAFNIGTGHAITLLRTLEVMTKLVGRNISPLFAPPRAGDIHESRAEVSLARQKLGFSATSTFETGLALTWKWFLDAEGNR
ncbi:MAG: SDR family oxidoreductase [Pseudomonadota bacterium]